MKNETTLPFAFVSIPDFSAWAYARSPNPSHDVLVVQGSRVIAATNRARRAGVATGVSVDRARVLAPNALVRARDRQLELAVWEEVLETLLSSTPAVETARLGAAHLGRPTDAVLRDVVAQLGATAACSMDRETAELGAARSSVGRMLSIRAEDRASFLRRFPVSRIVHLGLGSDMAERLDLFGYSSLYDAAVLSLRQWEAQFGAEGRRLHALLHPPAEPRAVPLLQPEPRIVATVELDPPCSQPCELLPAIDHLAAEAGHPLGKIHTRRVTVRIGTTEGPLRLTRILPEATTSVTRVARTARRLLLDALAAGLSVEVLAIELGGLAPASDEQGALFARRRPARVAVKGVHRRFPGAIRRAILVEALFPEDRVRFDPFPEEA